MNDSLMAHPPQGYNQIKEATQDLKFDMASDMYTGSLLKTLIASKSGGRFLELGTGTGLATAWMLAGLDASASLISVENNGLLVDIAKKYIDDKRVEFVLIDAYEWIVNYSGPKFDLIFADAMPGKYDLFSETIDLLNKGGFYIIDDMLPQPNWPAGHELKVEKFISQIEERADLIITKMNWSTGVIIVVKK